MRSSYAFIWRDRNVLELLTASMAGRLCFSMLPLAVVLFSRDVSGSIAVAGAATGAFGITSGVLAPLRGHLVDRVGWPALAAFSLAFGVALAAFVAAGLLIDARDLLVSLAGVAGALVPPIGAAARGVWGATFHERERERQAMYAADSTLEEGTLIVGPLVVGGLVALASPAAAVAVATAGVFAGGLASATSSLGRTVAASDPETPKKRGPGLNRRLLLVIASFLGPAAALGCLEITVPAFALEHGSIAWSGPLLAAFSAGSVAGGLWYGTRTWRRTRPIRYLAAASLLALLLVPAVFASSLTAMALLLFLPGLAVGPAFVLLYELVDQAATPGRGTSAFSLVVTANNGGIAVGAATAGALVATSDPGAGFALAAGAAASGSLVAAWMAKVRFAG